MTDDTTTGELSRNVQKLEVAIQSLTAEIAHSYVTRNFFEEVRRSQGERLGATEQRIDRVEGTLTSINRIAWTGVVLPVVVGIIVALLVASLKGG